MRVVVASWLGSTNLGDELIFSALHRKLTARGATVVGISLDPAATRSTHGVNAVGHRDVARLWSMLGSGDRMVFGGGGLLQDETSRFNLPYHLPRLAGARARRMPAAVIGIGAGPLETTLGQNLVRAALQGVTGVATRDAESAAVLSSLGLPQPTLAADLALSLPLPDAEPADRTVVCLRPWAGRGAPPVELHWQRGLHNDWFADAMAAALDQTARASGLATHFLAFQRDRDHRLHQLVADRMQTPVTVSCPEAHEVVAQVSRSRVVIAMRYHAGIAAVLGSRPCVLVSYSSKVPSLAADIGPGAASVAWDAESIASIPAAVMDVLEHEATIPDARARLQERELGNDAVLDRLLSA